MRRHGWMPSLIGGTLLLALGMPSAFADDIASGSYVSVGDYDAYVAGERQPAVHTSYRTLAGSPSLEHPGLRAQGFGNFSPYEPADPTLAAGSMRGDLREAAAAPPTRTGTMPSYRIDSYPSARQGYAPYEPSEHGNGVVLGRGEPPEASARPYVAVDTSLLGVSATGAVVYNAARHPRDGQRPRGLQRLPLDKIIRIGGKGIGRLVPGLGLILLAKDFASLNRER